MKKIIFILILIAIVGFIGTYFFGNKIQSWLFRSQIPTGEIGANLASLNQSTNSDSHQPAEPMVETIAENLRVPWAMAWLPSGEILVTQRPGQLVKISPDRQIIEIQGVRAIGEGGLQGLAVHPDFVENNFIYLYLTTDSNGQLTNQVERYRLINNELQDRTIIIGNIPAATYHDGGRIKFGPDLKLYITTGDAQKPDQAQNLNYLGGKILRINDNGTIPPDNPFPDSPVYSLGHRNPQGLAWDDQGRLWSTEHGRSIPQSGYDELNLIAAGQNYGWPKIQGDQSQAGMVNPIINSGADSTWAPSGVIYLNGSIFFAGLRGEAIYQYEITTKKFTTHFFQDFGRLRELTIGPDSFIYLTTSNLDGRGQGRTGDDKIIKLNPQIFQ